MNRRMCIALVGAAMATVMMSSPVASWAQKKVAKPAANLPPATQILDQASAAMGSKAAFDNVKTMTMRGKISIPAQKINGTMETTMKFPDKVYVIQNISGFGRAEQGFDGKIGWSRDPINGLRTLAGGELRQMKSQAEEARSSSWRDLYQKPVMIGIRKVGTADAYAIRLTPKRGGKPVEIYYDVRTKLPVRTVMTIETPQGSVPTESYSSDFRTISGMKIPFKTRQVVGGVSEVNVTFDDVKINTPVKDTLFAKPPTSAPPAPAPAKP